MVCTPSRNQWCHPLPNFLLQLMKELPPMAGINILVILLTKQSFIQSQLFSLPVSSSKIYSLCNSCSINKEHQLSFHQNSLTSQAPLDLIYTNVWGPVSSTGIDGSRYYLIFVDHFSKYIQFYTMVNKSDVSMIFS